MLPARVRVPNLPSHSKTFDSSLFTVSSRAFSEVTSLTAWSPLWTVFAALPPDERIRERVTRSLIETPEGCTSSTKTIPTSDFRSSRPGHSTIRLKVVTPSKFAPIGHPPWQIPGFDRHLSLGTSLTPAIESINNDSIGIAALDQEYNWASLPSLGYI